MLVSPPRRHLYHYELLFADEWAGRLAVARERCLARHRAAARSSSQYVYDYMKKGGWTEIRNGREVPAPNIRTLKSMATDRR